MVPSRATGNYNDEFDDEELFDLNKNFSNGKNTNNNNNNYKINSNAVEFYYDFAGFLPGN